MPVLMIRPQYWEIYRLKEVVGISLIFMAIDIAGGLFSLLSLVFREEFDIAACVSYTLVVVLDGLVVILAFILNPIARRRRRREAEKDAEEERALGMASPTDTLATRVADEAAEEHGEKNVRVMPMPDLREEMANSVSSVQREEGDASR